MQEVQSILFVGNCNSQQFFHSFLLEYLDDNIPEEREAALAFGLDLLKLSKAIVVCGSRISSGMRGEIRLAGELNIPAYALIESVGGFALAKITQEEKMDEVQVCKGNIS